MINLEWLRTFKSVYETQSFTKAARELYISQPGVSLHIGSLEAYVGYSLFERISKKLIPTEKAKILYNFTLEPLLKLETAEQTFHKTTKTERATVSIGMCFETFQITLEQYISTLPFNVIIRFGEYPEMVENLEKGILDIIITPQMVPKASIEYQPFSSETIVIVGGNQTDETEFEVIESTKDSELIEAWLKQQKWYGTTGDMEHLRRFWQLNFNKYPDFRPNYIVPNLNSIVRCLSSGQGLAVIPDFLCKKELESKQIKLIWKGKVPLENTLHFATRKKTIYADEINLIKKIFIDEMA